MTDVSKTIAPKSDQLNSDDLIGGPLTIKVTRVNANEGSPEQPINVYFEGDGGKPYRPCKSMRRVMVHVWGKDGAAYVGRSLTLYRDAEVQFGGVKVGGTRISHMSDIQSPQTMALTATRANRKPFTVQPLKAEPKPDPKAEQAALDEAREAAGNGVQAFTVWWNNDGRSKREMVKPFMAELQSMAKEADIAPESDETADPFGLPDDSEQEKDVA